MKEELFFGIDPLDYIYQVNNPLKQRELALHLFCNLNISTQRGQQIFHETSLLMPNEFEMLIEKVKSDYADQQAFPQILDDEELFAKLRSKLSDWIELNDLPRLDELYRAAEIFQLPNESVDLLLEDNLIFGVDYLYDYIAWFINGEQNFLSNTQLKAIKELHCILKKSIAH